VATGAILYLDLKLSELEKLAKGIDKSDETLQKYAKDLAQQTHAKVGELAQEGLHMRRERYIAALHFEPVDDSTWVISLNPDAVWIEDGLPEDYHMLDKLLASSKAKTAKDGSKYVVVPFNHNKGTHLNSESGKSSDDLKLSIQQELRKRKIPFNKLERDINTGEPKLGKLHDIEVPFREHPKKTHEGIGQGQGSIGDVRQGATGTRHLSRIEIHQRMGKDRMGRPQAMRGIMTFRTASSKQDASERWVHPGLPAKRFFEEAYDWALKEWETVIVPRVLADLSNPKP